MTTKRQINKPSNNKRYTKNDFKFFLIFIQLANTQIGKVKVVNNTK